MQLPGRPKFEVHELAWPRDGEGSKGDRVQRLGPDLKEHKIWLPYETDEKRLTTAQKSMKAVGYDYRISAAIKRIDENNQVYDLSEQMKVQFHYFPFGGLKDLIDAFSRIYDMEVRPPRLSEAQYAEPEWV
jgi:hypothetical protein